jgi:hypothetical protein
MNQDQDITEVVRLIQKEHQRTRIVFGLSIIVLSILMTFISSAVIRSTIQNSSVPLDDAYLDMTMSLPTEKGMTSTTSTTTATEVGTSTETQ